MREYSYKTYKTQDVRNNNTSINKQNEGVKRSSPTGRFRPPPFFDTVLTLRQRLYELGGKAFRGTDEPPSDRNVHKLWRAVEKYKVDYSLQHYFYVASLSNRCFDLVERIHHKVSRGLLEGSRDKEVNQSYFNFLYGKTEEEQYRLLSMLENGELTPKDFLKIKKNNNTNKNTDQGSLQTCNHCNEAMKKMSDEKDELETKYMNLKRKYEELVDKSTQNDS